MMVPTFVAALVAAAALVATPVSATDSIVLYRDYYFRGPTVELGTGEATFPKPYNDWCSSAKVKGGTWMLYSDFNYQGTVSILEPGSYRDPNALGQKNDVLSSIRPFPPASATSILLFRDYDFKGPMLHLTGASSDLRFFDFNDHASSVIVLSGTWRLYQHTNYGGRAVDMAPGRYKRVATNDDLSSCKPLPGPKEEVGDDEMSDDDSSAENFVSEVSEVTEELERFRHQVELE